MKDSRIEWIGDIPDEWELSKIGAVYEERNEKVNDVDFQPLSVTKQGIVPQLESAAKTSDGDNRKLICKNDFVINSRSDRRGSCGISEYDGSCSLINTVLKPKINICNTYYSFVFRSECFADEFYRWGNGIVDDLWSTKWANMKRIYIPAPSLDEQQRIADYLSRKCCQIDSIIAKHHEVIDKLKAYKMSAITEAVTRGIEPNVPMKDSGVEWIGEIPAHWEVMRFGRCATIKSNLVTPDDYLDYPQISPDSIEKNSGRIIDFKTVKESGVVSNNHLFFKGQVLYSKIRPMLKKVAIAPFDGLCSADMYPIETKNDTQFLVYMLLSDYFTSQVGLVTEDRVKMPRINQSELSATMVTIPPLYEQEIISKYLSEKCSSLDVVIDKKQVLIDKLNDYKKSIIYEVVTGKKEV